jgi:hypothetical protein
MKAKPEKVGERKPAARHAPTPVALGLKVKNLRDGNALALDANGGTVG